MTPPPQRYVLVALDHRLFWDKRTELSRHYTRTAAETMAPRYQRPGRTVRVEIVG